MVVGENMNNGIKAISAIIYHIDHRKIERHSMSYDYLWRYDAMC